MTTNSTPGTENSGPSHDSYSQGFKLAVIICLSVSAILGFIGNALVVAVIFRAKKLRSVMNRFVLHLAISDLIVCSLCIPLFLLVNFRFVDGVVKCKITRFLQYLAPEASMTILITIGLNRHRAVVHPLRMMTYNTANKLITSAWAYAIVVVTPSLYLTEAKPTKENSTVLYCATIPGTLLGRLYVIFMSTFGYLIPLAVLIILYGKICKTVWLRQSNNLGQTLPAKAYIQSRKKVLKMFLTVILMFLVTWLPLLVYVGAIESTNPAPSHIDHTRLIVYSIGLCNSTCNPFIYALFNPNFRAGCKDLCASFRLFRFGAQSANHAPTRDAKGFRPDVLKQNYLNRRGGVRATDSNSNKKQKKSLSQTTTNKKQSMKPFYSCFTQREGFVLNQDEHYCSNRSLTAAVSQSLVELTMFQRIALVNDVTTPQKETEEKL